MPIELQRLVDGIADRTGRPVVLEDRRQRMIVYSEHDEPVDRVRSESILSRRTRPEVVAWLRNHGIASSPGPVRTPSHEELGLLPRVCVPIRHEDLLLGFLWFVDRDASMTDAELADVASTLDRFPLALYRENLAGELASNRVAEAVRSLLDTTADAPAPAATELIAEGRFPDDVPVVALVAQPVLAASGRPDELFRLAIEQALVAVRRTVGGHAALHLVRYDHGVLLVPDGRSQGGEEVADVAELLHTELARACTGLPAVEGVLVGRGQAQPSLTSASTSYDQARQAAKVAAHLPVTGAVAEWAKLGIYRALARLSEEEVEAAILHPGLQDLLGDERWAPLVDTLETYLDLAGNVQAAAEALSLHRTSLYHRLGRIEQLCATDLRDGNERLALHLGLKLARLSGRR